MQKNYTNEIIDKNKRLETKNFQTQFTNFLEAGTNCSFFESRVIAENIDNMLDYICPNSLKSGQIIKKVIHYNEPAGKPLKDCEFIDVKLTLIDEKSDLEILKKEQSAGLRRHKMTRLTEEAIKQNGILTQEDLSLLLGCDIRTIKRDIKYLKGKEIYVRTRGRQKDIGPTITHRKKAIEQFMKNISPPDIARNINHSLKAVERYIMQFSRVYFLNEKNINPLEISFLVGISTSLTNELIDMTKSYCHKKDYQEKIQEIKNTGKNYFNDLDIQKKILVRGK